MENQNNIFSIQSGRFFRALGYIASICQLVLLLFIIAPPQTLSQDIEAITKNATPATMTFTSVNSSATVSLNVIDSRGSFARSNSDAEFTIRTNNATGYTLNLKTSGSNTALTDSETANTLSSISNATSYSTFSGTDTTSQALNNKWGIIPSKYNGLVNTDNYYPASSTGFKMDATTAANATANNYTVGLGVRANFNAPAGTYTNTTLVAEYVANPVTYSINYYKNTTDSIVGMPSVNPQTGAVSQGTISTSVNLAAAPTRTGYTFIGWCKGSSSTESNVTTNTTTGVDSCSSSVYDAGQSFGINATSTSPDTYFLHAMWSLNSYTCTKRYRLQNADGSWGDYKNDGTEQIKYGRTCNYNKTITNYKNSATGANNSTASTSGIMTENGLTLSLDLYRNTYTCFIQSRDQNADGTYGSYTTRVNTTVRYGATCSWSAPATTSHKAASYSNNNVTTNVSQSVNVDRKTFTVTKQYRLQGADGNYPSAYTSDGTATVRYGDSYTYSIAATTSHQSASTTVSSVTSSQTVSLNVPRKTFTCKISYKYQAADGTYGSATVAVNTTKRYGEACSWSTANISNFDSTTYKAANYTNNSITANVDTTVNIDRNTFTVTKRYRLQGTDGTYPTTYTSGGTETVRYGASTTYSIAATTTHQAASKSSGAVTAATTISLDVPRKTVACNTRYRLENADGTWASYISDTATSAYYGGSCSYSKTVTNYRGSASGANNSAGSTSASNVTSAQTLSISLYRNTYTCYIQYRLQAANGTYGSYTAGTNTTLRHGQTCSWSRAADATYKAASYSTTITSAVSQSISVDRNTFTVTKRYRLQETNGIYPSSYTADGTATVRYGDSYTYSRAATTTHQAASKASGTVTAATTISLDVPRNLVVCNKRYRLQNADGTYPTSYTNEGSVNAYYGGDCSYSKTVTDYNSNTAKSISASNVTTAQTLSLDFPRNTYTLTVSKGANIASVTGGGTYRWGQSVAITATKSANTTCISYANPTWSASTGTAPSAGASSTYTMPKSNATVTAASVASNINQTITLSRSGGASGIKIGNTNYTSSSVSLTCGTYNITGSYNSGYEFSSWSRANGVAVASATSASTTMTVTGAGTLTLAGKESPLVFKVNFDSGIDSVIVRGNTVTSTILTTVTTSGTDIGSMVSVGGTYYLLPLYKKGKTLSNITASGGTVTAGTYGYRYYTIARGTNSTTVSSTNLATTSSTTMQNLASNTCQYYPTAVKDSRDNELYYIQRLADGNCWMLDNMRLGGTTSMTLTTSDTNIGGYTYEMVGTPPNIQAIPVPVTSYTLPASSWTTSYSNPKIYASEKNDTILSYGPGSGKIGVLYNVCALTAGNVCTYSGSSTSYDLCPAGWRLPTGGPSGEHMLLMDYYGATFASNDKTMIYGNVTNYNKAISAAMAGSYGSSRRIENWLWLSSSTYSTSCKDTSGGNGNICFAGTGPSSATPMDSNYWNGQEIRCVLKTN